jgi:hypothetical protein
MGRPAFKDYLRAGYVSGPFSFRSAIEFKWAQIFSQLSALK